MNANLDPEQARVALEALNKWSQTAIHAPEDTVVCQTARRVLRSAVESDPHALFTMMMDEGATRQEAREVVYRLFGAIVASRRNDV